MVTTSRALLQPGNDWYTLYAPPSLNSFVVSNTPMGSVRWWKPELASWEDFADRHVLFQKESTGHYMSKIFKRSLVDLLSV